MSPSASVGFGPDTLERLRALLPDDAGDPPIPGRRSAAVLVPLFSWDGEVRVLLTLRTAHLRRHSGQVSFPGGGWEPADGTLLSTALRESHEEVGLHPSDVDVLGVLDDLHTMGSDYVIRPYVASIAYPYEFVPHPHEVDRIFTAPLGFFADARNRREEVREREGGPYTIYYYDVEGATVWGATARMLVRLVERLNA